MSEVQQITPDGLPVLLIENAPPEVQTTGFQLTGGNLFGDKTQDPVFVHTAREEFDYPSGRSEQIFDLPGHRRIPVGSFFLKVAAAISEGELTLFSPAISPARAA